MRSILSLLFFVMCCIKSMAQTYLEPFFDRTDYPQFHINQIKVEMDTTYVFCTYIAQANSWARISKETYLYDHNKQKKYTILKCSGLPFSPQQQNFPNEEIIQITFCFPSIGDATKIDFIEDFDKEAFNIYGIDLTNTFDPSYYETELKYVLDMSLSYDTVGDTINAIQYKEQEKKVTAFVFGVKSEQLLMVVFDLCDMYEKYGFHQKANEEKKKISDYIDGLEDNIEKWQLLSSMSNVFSNRNGLSKSLEYRTRAVEIGKKVYGVEHPKYAMSLHLLARNHYRLGNYEAAIQSGSEALEIRKQVWGMESSDYATSLSDLALYYSALGNYEEAIRLGTESLKIRKKILGTENPDYATTLGNLSSDYTNLGNYEEAIRLGTEALEIRGRVLGTDHPDYAMILNNLAVQYSRFGNYKEAIRLGKEALEIRKRVLGTEHPNYATTLANLAIDYSLFGNYEEAIRLGKEALEIRKTVFGTDHPNYASSLNDLATFFSNLGNNEEAIRLGTEALEIQKKVLGTEHPDYARSLSNLAAYSADLGNYGEAIRLGTEALNVRRIVLRIEHPDYALSLGNLASYYSHIGNYGEAIRLGTEALNIQKKVLGTEHPDYAKSLSILANIYTHLGDYGEAIRFGTEALGIRKRSLGMEHPDYALSLGNLAVSYEYRGNYEESTRLITRALEIIKKVHGVEHPNYAITLDILASNYSNLGNYKKAIKLETEAVDILKRIWGPNHPEYARSLSNLAEYHSYLGNYGEAIQLATKAMEIRGRGIGPNHPDYALSLSNLAVLYLHLGNYIEAYKYFKNSVEVLRPHVLSNLVEQSSHMKESFWGNKYEYNYTSILPTFVYKNKNAESIAELYNYTCLFAKGLLLNSDIELRRLILESEDSLLIEKYNALSTNISIYNKLIEKPINERFMNADSLNNVIQQQEMELARESKIYGDYTRNLTSTWKDVQNHLGTDDIAIEFIDFPILGTDSIMYAALTLKKDYESPHMVTLFEKKQLMGIPDSTYYTRTSTCDLIWKPLEEELENVKIIYFAPSGELHRIGIEYLPFNKTEIISDKYSLHRLSSTRQLALIQDGTKGEQSILYGGINYDENTNATPHVSTSSVGGVRGANIIYRSNVDSLLLRSSYEYLEGTKREVDQIADQMKQHQIHYQYYSGTDGSEESFKKLDGTKPKMMHIATHGFYLTEEEAKLSNFARPQMELMMGDNQRAGRPVEDKPMTRSGLLFSGCNHAIHHEPIPDGVEDGILTAQEISTLDLRGLDLVVLSACQTALGDIASGEGVFGLQRGFKKAGAKTIIMSLWKVDDEATRILMVELYRNLMSGKSKQQSLKDAQKYLREYDNGKYDKPEYWASFIMLDGLD